MLNRRDREQLEHIEQQLRADDPNFTARFDAPSRHTIMARWSTVVSRVLPGVLGLAAIVALLLGHAAAGSVAAAVAIALFVIARGWRLHSD